MASEGRILLVDDDVELVELLRDYLTCEGFEVSSAHDGPAGLAAMRATPPDIAILDVMMPGLSGLQVLAQIRASSQLPVIMLTARGDDTDRILGLELGADDYVPKPCTPRELAARIRAVLKRTLQPINAFALRTEIVVGQLILSSGRRRAEFFGRDLALTSTEYGLLEALARQAGTPVAKEVLSEQALGRPLSRYDRSIDVHVSSIRQKLGVLPDGRSPIQTVIRKGYQLLIE